MGNLILKRYATYSLSGQSINVDGSFPVYIPEGECLFDSKKEITRAYIEKMNRINGNKTCEDLGKLIDKKLYTNNPNLPDEKVQLNKIIYGIEEYLCYECLP